VELGVINQESLGKLKDRYWEIVNEK